MVDKIFFVKEHRRKQWLTIQEGRCMTRKFANSFELPQTSTRLACDKRCLFHVTNKKSTRAGKKFVSSRFLLFIRNFFKILIFTNRPPLRSVRLFNYSQAMNLVWPAGLSRVLLQDNANICCVIDGFSMLQKCFASIHDLCAHASSDFSSTAAIFSLKSVTCQKSCFSLFFQTQLFMHVHYIWK